jgi:hypothetical protein
MVLYTPQQPDLLFSEVIPEVCDSVFRVTDQLCLGLCTVEFFAFDVGEDSGNLTVWHELVFAHFLLVGKPLRTSFFVGNDLGFSILSR